MEKDPRPGPLPINWREVINNILANPSLVPDPKDANSHKKIRRITPRQFRSSFEQAIIDLMDKKKKKS